MKNPVCAAEGRQDARAAFYERAFAHETPIRGKYTVAAECFRAAGIRCLLDVGGGTGDFAAHCQSIIPGLEATVVDIGKEAVDIATRRGIRALALDVGNAPLPFEDNTFDGVFCGEVLEHVFDTDAFIEEVRRVVKPSAGDSLKPLVLTTPNLASWYNRILLLLGFQPLFTEVSTRDGYGHPFPFWLGAGHIRIFTCRALRQFVARHGLETVRTVGFGSTRKWDMANDIGGYSGASTL